MLQLIIDAYEEKNKDESFFKSLKKMDNLNKASLVVMILGLVLSFMLFKLNKIKWGLYSTLAWIILFYVFIYIMSVKTRKNWKDNISNYNMKLDCLKDILSEEKINYYSKNKIEKLIEQCEKSINDLLSEKEKKMEHSNRFIERYILPIVAYGAGVLTMKINFTEVLQICIIAIFIVFILKIYIWEFRMLIEKITGNELEKEKYMKVTLEDLLIRDFVVKDSNSNV